MSNHLTSLAYKLELGSLLRKSVLVLLADKASDDGSGIWASKQTMADELCCSKQAVWKTIQEFMDEGLLAETGRKQHRNGYTITYSLKPLALEAMPRVQRWADNQSTALTSQPDAPVNVEDLTGQPGLPKPYLTPLSEDKSSSDLDDFVEAWNSVAVPRGAIRCNRLRPERRKKLAAVLKRYPVEDLTEAIDAVGRSEFLTGRTPRKFRASITFLCSPEHIEKLLEGSYG